MMRVAIAVLAVIMMTGSADAAFTAEEKASLAELGQAQLDLLTGDNAIQGATRSATLPATHQALARLSRASGEASFRLHEILGALSNGRITGTQVPPNATRAYFIAQARDRHARAADALDKTAEALQKARALEPENGPYQHSLDVAHSRRLRASRHFAAIDMTLPYGNPWPSVESTRTTRQVLGLDGQPLTVGVEMIGPHGRYTHAIDSCWWAGRYWDHARTGVTNIYARGPVVASTEPGTVPVRVVPTRALADGIVDGSAIMLALTRAMLLFHDVVINPADAQPNRFLTVLRAGDLIWDATPKKYLAATAGLSSAVLGLAEVHHKDARDVLRRLADSWEHAHGGCIAGLMGFPGMTR